MKLGIFALLSLMAAAAFCGEFFPDGFTLAECAPDAPNWQAQALVVKDGYPVADDAAISNFVANGGAIVVLQGEAELKAPAFLAKRRSDPLGKLFAWPKPVEGAGAVARSCAVHRFGKGFLAVVPESLAGEALVENIEWHLGFQNQGYVFLGDACSLVDGAAQAMLELVYVRPPEAESPQRQLRLEIETTSDEGTLSAYETLLFNTRTQFRRRTVASDLVYLHGEVRVRTFFSDLDAGFKVQMQDQTLRAPDYLELILPIDDRVSVDRAEPSISIGVRINDEPHAKDDLVRITFLGPDRKPRYETQVVLADTEATTWFEIPLTNSGDYVGRCTLVAETVRDIDVPIRVERPLTIVSRVPFCYDQDGMALQNGVRTFLFGTDASVTNASAAIVRHALGEPLGMTSTFGHALHAARRKLGKTGKISGEIDLSASSGDAEADARAIRSLAYLGFVAGGQAIWWQTNALNSRLERVTSRPHVQTDLDAFFAAESGPLANLQAAQTVAVEIAALGPDVLRPARTIVSTDGFVFARRIGDKLIAVNTERRAAHPSVLKGPELPNGSLTLTLDPDEVRVLALR